MTTVDRDAVKAFRKQMVGVLNDAALGLLLGIGDELGLFDVLAQTGPADSVTLASAAGVDERYLREWLDGIVAGDVAEYDPDTRRYTLPPEHAASLTASDGPVNLARSLKLLTTLAGVTPDLRERFRSGGGLGYEAFPRFHALMAEESAATHDAGLLDVVVPAIPGLHEQLTRGAVLADVGCGAGHAVNLLARAYPASSFVGYDLGDEAIGAARVEAAEWGLTNASFEIRDIAQLNEEAAYDVVTAFDAIHDQAFPDQVLAGIATALRPGGTFLMVDIKAETGVENNLALPWATYLYTLSLMHCMTVSLAQGGAGLGAVWGRQRATQMLEEAGLGDVEVKEIRTDPFNYFYVARRPST
ncbi:MAG: class I SAM-dependent methyltransferase [Nocardioidaceae bacterium]